MPMTQGLPLTAGHRGGEEADADRKGLGCTQAGGSLRAAWGGIKPLHAQASCLLRVLGTQPLRSWLSRPQFAEHPWEGSWN